MKRIKDSGFTTTELMIALAITSVVGLGGAVMLGRLEKGKSKLSSQTDYMIVEKAIEGYLSSPKGCSALKDLPVGSEDVEIQPGGEDGPIYRRGSSFGPVDITGLKIDSFSAVNSESSSGIAKIQLKMQKKGSTEETIRHIPVSVNIADGVIQDCNYSRTRAFNDLMNKACEEAYGLSASLSCQQIRDLIMNRLVESICQDIYGPSYRTVSYPSATGGTLVYCDMSELFKSQDCGTQFAQGIRSNGTLNCVTATLPPPPTCDTWGSWYPSTSTVCSGQNFTQKRDCTSGAVMQENQSATGTKSITYSFSPGPPANYCPSQYVTRTNNCDLTTTDVPGTKSDPSCSPTCPPTTGLTWSSGNCRGDLVSGSDGEPQAVPNLAAGYTGAATFKCQSGSWNLVAGSTSCVQKCSGAVSWGGSCGHNFAGAESSGTAYTVANSNSGYNGSADYICNNGTLTLQSSPTPTCNPSGPTTSSGGSGCFIAGTLVRMGDGSRKAIEDLKSGDEVLSFDLEANATRVNRIIEPIAHVAMDQKLFTFYLSNGESFTANDEHPLFIENANKWMSSLDVAASWDRFEAPKLLSSSKEVVDVLFIVKTVRFTEVFNISVERDHNYFVGDVLVHNKMKTDAEVETMNEY